MYGPVHPRSNLAARGAVLLLLAAAPLAGVTAYAWMQSSYRTGVGRVVLQPVPFSHQHHVAGLGLDCRYCHATAGELAFAGMPTSDVCMNCHAQIWTQAPVLAPIRESWKRDEPVQWTRVNDLPDYVFFDHAVHVQNGIGCSSCHGRIDLMPLTHQAETLYMQWCLDCHRNPERFIRPREEVYNMNYKPPGNQRALGTQLVGEYGVQTEGITDCTACHR